MRPSFVPRMGRVGPSLAPRWLMLATLGRELGFKYTISVQFSLPLECFAHCSTLVTSLYRDCSLVLLDRQASLESTPL